MKVKHTIFISLLFAAVVGAPAQDRLKTHSFHFRDLDLRAGLDSLLQWYSVPLIYLEKDVAGKRVSADCSDCRFEDALTKVIEGCGLLWKMAGGQAVLQQMETKPEVPATFAGMIRDSLTGEAVVDADIALLGPEDPSKIYRWCSTNQFGFFSLRTIQPGAYVINLRRIGYRTINEAVNIQPGDAGIRDINLSPQQLMLPEITIQGRRSALTASEGISRGVYIRGTPSDQNQYLLEGTRIYNPLHFGGILSTFNGDALRDLQVIPGGVPPYYGGRIGGILDVTLRDGGGERISGSTSFGTLSSSLILEGPLFDRMSYLISGRRGYPDVLFPWYRGNDRISDLGTSEVLAKVTRHLSGNQRLSLTGYFGRDSYENQIAGIAGSQLSNSLRWGNAAVNLRWIGAASSSLFFYTSAIFTRYAFDAEHRLAGFGSGPGTILSDYMIEDIALRAHAEYFYDEYHTVQGGAELVRHRTAGRISDFSSQIAPMSLDGYSPSELSVYFQDQWRLVPSVLAELGARATSFVSREGSLSAVDPRFGLLVSPDDGLRFYSSLSAVTQFMHPYRNSGIFLFYPSIFYYPSSDNVPASTSLHASLGIEKYFDEDRYRIGVESYFRTIQKLHEFVFDTTAQATLSDALLLGEGKVYGAEVTIDKRTGRFTGSLRYSVSWASNRFSGLNGGEPFRPRFDRRHEVYATVSYSPNAQWTLGAVCFDPSGLKVRAETPSDRTNPFTNGAYAEPYDLNGGRLPGFQRLELQVMHRLSWRNLPIEAALRLLNGYGLLDPFDWELRQSSDTRLRWRATFDPLPLFPLYPEVSLNVRF
ncbi:MAG: TonB-dependent receptor [Ignavibacteria bacterium]|nr:MAG: TonB-dependent receptor [Ignavibacteria bacterium]